MKRKTKWTPKRFVLLIGCLMSPFCGFIFPPLAILMPLFCIGVWRSAWQDDDYGYKLDGTFDWKSGIVMWDNGKR